VRNGPEISVVISTYRRTDGLSELVQSLSRQTLDPSRFEVIIVDNCSGDDTWSTLQSLRDASPFPLHLLQTTSNHGPARARNLGWRAADAPMVAFLDDDCLPEPNWLATGLEILQRDERLGLLQGRVRVPSEFDPVGMGTWYHCQIIDGPSPFFEACNIFYRRAALEDGQGFNEGFGWWGEDSELGWRVVEAGWGRSFSFEAEVVHSVQERGWRWYARTGFLERHTMKLARDHAGFRREAFWRPWAFRQEDVIFMLAAVGLVAGLRRRPALVLALPYLWRRRPRAGLQGTLRFFAQNVAVDASRSAGQLWGAVQHRIMVI
jgi:GT2 family glycosyltransferase